MSKSSAKTVMTKTQTADDILADLMNDLKEVDKTVIGFDPSQVSEDGVIADGIESTEMGAPDNLDLDLDAGVSSDALLPGLSDLNGEEEHATILTNVSVSMNPVDDEPAPGQKTKAVQNKNDVLTFFKADDDLGELNLETFQGVLERTKIEKAAQEKVANQSNSINQLNKSDQFNISDEKTSIFSGVELSDAPPEDSKFSKVADLSSDDERTVVASNSRPTAEENISHVDDLDLNNRMKNQHQSNDESLLDKTSLFQLSDSNNASDDLELHASVESIPQDLNIDQAASSEPFSFGSELDVPVPSDKTEMVPVESSSMSIGLNSALSALNKKAQQLEQASSKSSQQAAKEPSLFADDDFKDNIQQDVSPNEQIPQFESAKFNTDIATSISDGDNDFKTQVVSQRADTFFKSSGLSVDENGLEQEKTQDIIHKQASAESLDNQSNDDERTIAVAGYNQKRKEEPLDDKVKISVGQVRGNAFSTGYASWGSADSNLVQAENLKMAQEKILELERENEKLRQQNEDLISASEIVKERADLLNGQLLEFKNDREYLEQSFKNELSIVKKQLERKENELQKAVAKADDLDSKIKFDLKKIRVRERELENRLELVRAEKNALMKSKDEQILDLKRKLDQVQLEVESYRQKCVDLNKVIETNQDSFKRTTRALRLAMANLELQEENKAPLKKVE